MYRSWDKKNPNKFSISNRSSFFFFFFFLGFHIVEPSTCVFNVLHKKKKVLDLFQALVITHVAICHKALLLFFSPFRYEKDVHLFKSKVVDSVKLCNSHLFDPPKIDDPYAIRLVNCLHF